MKEASGELSMTLIVLVAAGIIIAAVALFLPNITNMITNTWSNWNNKANDVNIVIPENILELK